MHDRLVRLLPQLALTAGIGIVVWAGYDLATSAAAGADDTVIVTVPEVVTDAPAKVDLPAPVLAPVDDVTAAPGPTPEPTTPPPAPVEPEPTPPATVDTGWPVPVPVDVPTVPVTDTPALEVVPAPTSPPTAGPVPALPVPVLAPQPVPVTPAVLPAPAPAPPAPTRVEQLDTPQAAAGAAPRRHRSCHHHRQVITQALTRTATPDAPAGPEVDDPDEWYPGCPDSDRHHDSGGYAGTGQPTTGAVTQLPGALLLEGRVVQGDDTRAASRAPCPTPGPA